MATPWWIGETFGQDPETGAVVLSYFDKTTGQPIYQNRADGPWYSQLPSQTNNEDGSTSYNPGVVAQDRGAQQTATFTQGISPYGNLGLQMGTLNGVNTYFVPLAGTNADQDKIGKSLGDSLSRGLLGNYGGGQSAYWSSASGSLGQVVTGPDGNQWVALPSDATFGEKDTVDHSGVMDSFKTGYLPIILAAVSGGLGNGLASSLAETLGGGITGQIGSKAILGGATSLLGGGDGITGALSGGLGSVLGGAMPSLDLGLPSYANAAITGGLGAAIGGGDPLMGAVMGAGGNLASGALGDLGLPAPATSAILGGVKSAIGGGDPIVGAIMGGGSSLLGQVAKAPGTLTDSPVYDVPSQESPAPLDMQTVSPPSQQQGTNALLDAFSSNPTPQSTTDVLASATTGQNPATAWSSDTFDNWDASLGQLPQSPSPAPDAQPMTGQPLEAAPSLPEPFQQPASSLPWEQPAGSLNTYTEQQPVTNPAEPVTQNPASGGGDMAFFDDLIGSGTDYFSNLLNSTGDQVAADQSIQPNLTNGAGTDYWTQLLNSTGDQSQASNLWPTTGDYSSNSIYDLDGSEGANYLNGGTIGGATDDLNLGQVQDLSNSGNMIPDSPSSNSLDSLLRSLGISGTGLNGLGSAINSLKGAITSASGQNLISRGLAAAPALAAINYAKNQTPFDTSKLSSVYDQFNPAAQTGTYDLATEQQRNALQSDLARRGVSGSSFGDQSLASFGTIRDLGRSALLNQGLSGQADIAAKIVDAQAKQLAAQNQLYGSALYALGGALSPSTGLLG